MNENTPLLPTPLNSVEKQSDTLSESYIGRSFGSYKIIHRIGAGGMGQVYLAHDSKLDRNVALKLLNPKLTGNHEHLLRFKQEARAASALNHPYILTIYEFGTSDEGVHFIASEYVEGRTLNRWSAEKDLDLAKQLDVLIRVASALSAAHEAGIVHRDVKPENVIVRPDGYVKVVDFGLVKLLEKFAGSDSDSSVETSPQVKTGSGVVMGTASYMSPEQAKGRKIDQRSDIFSFGVVLFEIVTGYLPFSGDSAMEIIASILHKEPRSIHDDSIPAEIKRIIDKALKKDPDERYQTMVDLLVDLREARREVEFQHKLERISKQFPGDDVTKMHRIAQMTNPDGGNIAVRIFGGRKYLYIPTALLLIVIAVAVAWFVPKIIDISKNSSGKVPAGIQKITNWANAAGELSSNASFSGDGRFVAFGSTQSGTTSIWVKQTNKGDAIQLTKDEYYNRYPIWSPDGDEIAYYSGRGESGGIWRVAQMGGQQKPVVENIGAESKPKRWSKSGKIYYQSGSELYSVDANSGEVVKLTDFASKNINPRIVDISPDERNAAFLSIENNSFNIFTIDLASSVINKVYETPNQIENFVWHPDSGRIILSRREGEFYQIFSVDLAGDSPVQLSFSDGDSFIEDISRDGLQILFSSVTEMSDLWRLDVSSSKESLIASQIDAELWADASPVNRSVVYQSIRNLRQGSNLFNGSLMIQTAEEDGRPAAVTEQGFLPQWSPDGKSIAFLRRTGARFEIWSIQSNGDQLRKIVEDGTLNSSYRITPYLLNESVVYSWSGDGTKIAYSGEQEGVSNIRIAAADGAGSEAVSGNTEKNRTHACPIWSPDGKKLAFVWRDRNPEPGSKPKIGLKIYTESSGEIREIALGDERVRFLGWSENGNDLIYLSAKREREFSLTPPQSILTSVSPDTREKRVLKTFEQIYFDNVHLSPDRRSLAFTARTGGKDDIWIWRTGDNDARRITDNRDSRLYFSSLKWSPDSGAIYFGKQSRFTLLSMFVTENDTEKKR